MKCIPVFLVSLCVAFAVRSGVAAEVDTSERYLDIGNNSSFLLAEGSDDTKRQCGARCQKAVSGCYSICGASNDQVNCKQGCQNRYRQCKEACGYEY